jgi:hypothetical protein
MDEFDVLDEVEVLEQNRTDQTVEVAPGHQAKLVLIRRHLSSPDLPLSRNDSLWRED